MSTKAALWSEDRFATRNKLIITYEGLPQHLCFMCQCLSFTGEVELYNFIQILSLCKIPSIAGPRLSNRKWNEEISSCIEKKLICISHQDIFINPLLEMVCAKDSVKSNTFLEITKVLKEWKSRQYSWSYRGTYLDGDVRAALVSASFKSGLNDVHTNQISRHALYDLGKYFNNPFDASLVIGLDYSFYPFVLKSILQDSLQFGDVPVDVCAFFMRHVYDGKDKDLTIRNLLCIHFLIVGQVDSYKNFAATVKEMHPETLAVEAALKGDNDTALKLFEAVLKAYRKAERKNNIFLEGPSGFLYCMCMLRSSNPLLRTKVYRMATQVDKKTYLYGPGTYLSALFMLFDDNGLFLTGKQHSRGEFYHPMDCIDALAYMLVSYWCGYTISDELKDLYTQTYKRVKLRGYVWVASEMAEALSRLTKNEELALEATNFRKLLGSMSFSNSVVAEAPWERALDALASMVNGRSNTLLGKAESSRVIWRVTLISGVGELFAVEQKLLKSGIYSAGKQISLRTMGGNLPQGVLTEQDKLVLQLLSNEISAYGIKTIHPALFALVGHPHVYRAHDPEQRVDIVKQELHLSVYTEGKGHKIVIDPFASDHDDGYIVKDESPDRILVYQIRMEHVRISNILGKTGLSVPAEGKEKLLTALNAVAPKMRVHTDIAEVESASTFVEPDCRPILQISGNNQGLSIEIFVAPLASGRLVRTGVGSLSVSETIEGNHIHTKRNFLQEKELLAKVRSACPVLDSHIDEEENSITISDPQECLEFLSEVRNAEPNVTVLWNERKPILVTTPISSGNLSLKIKSANEWFDLDGSLRIDENCVLTFRELIASMDNATGRFLPLDDGRFCVLTKEFQKQLARIKAFGTPLGKGTRIHGLAALALQDLTEEMPELEACVEWKKKVLSMRKTLSGKFEVPSVFEGELRNYQKDGFVWMARLAQLGAGACLADDMGLGKTVQTIAVLLHRASKGPALILAPTSVCQNWVDEIVRFGPTLNPQLFAAHDRKSCIANATAQTVIVCSYGLLNSETELFASREWNTIVLDEAQAIKNNATQRSKAVMELKSAFRLVTTGTPLENHLGELWNIFRFINPGLLGTQEEFNKRFAGPIQQKNDQEARLRLKSVIAPFILRRLKNNVLDELPPKTEKIIHVEMSQGENALYESLRQKALEELADPSVKGKHIRILAQIMKLRRMCCHPSLVAPSIPLAGSKLAAFSECVDELLDNKHRSLVFSQFVDHLTIVKNYCDTKKISYQYLDGQTPSHERSVRINAFQSGEGSLFLMSLKAGGVGINLTGADYVILLDPWWNPAVEDQASARAYRIGQQRPVTIYRLIMKGTIEEKIVDLHKHKRELAESLLEGGEMSGSMSAEDLMALIRETAG